MALAPRADDLPPGWVREGDWIVPWWHSRTGLIVKWIVFLVVLALVMGYIIGGYWHARLRMKKGLAPLAYHRCLVARRLSPPPPTQYQHGWPQGGYYAPNGYGPSYRMDGVPPPPVYDPSRPPVYPGAPDGATKVDPSQWRAEPTR